MTVYIKFSDRVHLFFNRVHFLVRIISYVLYIRIGKVFSKRMEFFCRILVPAQRAAGGCSPRKVTPGRGPAARRIFFYKIDQN